MVLDGVETLFLRQGDALRNMEILLLPVCLTESSFRRLRAAGLQATQSEVLMESSLARNSEAASKTELMQFRAE